MLHLKPEQLVALLYFIESKLLTQHCKKLRVMVMEKAAEHWGFLAFCNKGI